MTESISIASALTLVSAGVLVDEARLFAEADVDDAAAEAFEILLGAERGVKLDGAAD